jgi:hypothetical protein
MHPLGLGVLTAAREDPFGVLLALLLRRSSFGSPATPGSLLGLVGPLLGLAGLVIYYLELGPLQLEIFVPLCYTCVMMGNDVHNDGE